MPSLAPPGCSSASISGEAPGFAGGAATAGRAIGAAWAMGALAGGGLGDPAGGTGVLMIDSRRFARPVLAILVWQLAEYKHCGANSLARQSRLPNFPANARNV